MKITIRVRYKTRFGQALFLCGNHPLFGDGKQEQAIPLHYTSEDFWETSFDLAGLKRAAGIVNYYFLVREVDGSVLEDYGADRKLDLGALPRGHTVIIDAWNDLDTVENAYTTEPFKNVLLHVDAPPKESAAAATHTFNAKAPWLPESQTLCLLGSAGPLGLWNTITPVLLERDADGQFTVAVDLGAEKSPVMYKYGVYDLERHVFLHYEDGDNRTVTDVAPAEGRVVLNDGFARLPAMRWRGAGVAIPVFSLRSEKSFGVGEFLDLMPLADWAAKVGLKMIQVLPVNDTTATHTWMDSYPYAGISAFALHPQYLNLDRLAAGDTGRLKSLAAQRKALNALPQIDYELMMKGKLAFIRDLFPAHRESTLTSPGYKKYFEQNKHWLAPYATFCFLRDKYGTADFRQWPEHQSYHPKKIDALIAGDSMARDEIELIYFIQFHLHLQLREAVDHLHSKGLILKGDIAIGVYPHSADVWQQPELFHADMQAGAPPDPFAAKGQNWGFPTYNWPRMLKDGLDWWKRRFAQMGNYFDAFRVDHILGFFRIWSIPRNAVEGILGYFVPALPVQPAEFVDRGIPFNHERYTLPFINDDVLREIFGGKADAVKKKYLKPAANGLYALKPKFATQRDVEKSAEADDKQGLFDLISNVILIETPGGELHFRFGIEETTSFRHLDVATQKLVKDLYIDYFYRRQEEFWRREGMRKLPALKRVTNMLICGEDLGMVPACVPLVMKQLGLLGLEIQRMPKTLNVDFSRPADAPYLSVVTPSTHDMSTIRGWWIEERKITQQFFNLELHQPGPAPAECEAWINREIVKQHLASPAMWSVFQLQDLLGMDYGMRHPDVAAERINIPAIPRYYWRYRMHLTLEELAGADNFNWLLENLIQQSGR